MGSFIDATVGYPTAVYSALLVVVLFYWVLAVIGVIDFESGMDLDLHADGDIDDLGALAGFVVAFGLNGVPFSVAISLVVLISWTVSCLAGMWLLPWVPTMLLQVLAGTAVLLASFAVSIPVTARVLRPLRGLFVTHSAISSASLVGQTCRVLTGSVDETFGDAEVPRRGASLNIYVTARVPNALTKGSVARIVEYDPATQRYLIEPEPES
jgi:hypothetical protein